MSPDTVRKLVIAAVGSVIVGLAVVAGALKLGGPPWAVGLGILIAFLLSYGMVLIVMWRLLKETFALRTELRVADEKLRELADRAVPLDRKLHYLVDLVLSMTSPPAVNGGNPLAAYARVRYEKQIRTMAFAQMLEASRIRELYLAEIFPGIERVSVPVGAINEQTFHANHADLLYVCAIARHRGAKNLFEFGTYQGRTTYHLTLASDGARVTTLNLPPEKEPTFAQFLGQYFKGTDREKFITQVLSDSREFDTTPCHGQFDFVFVDGDHGYDLVKNDTQKAFELLKPGGAILWHDYAPKSEGLVRFFQEFSQKRPLFRIKRTCLLLHVDGVDPMTFTPHPMPPSLEADTLKADPYIIEELYHA